MDTRSDDDEGLSLTNPVLWPCSAGKYLLHYYTFWYLAT